MAKTKIERLAEELENMTPEGRDRLDARLKAGPSNTVQAQIDRLSAEADRLFKSPRAGSQKRTQEIVGELQALEELL